MAGGEDAAKAATEHNRRGSGFCPPQLSGEGVFTRRGALVPSLQVRPSFLCGAAKDNLGKKLRAKWRIVRHAGIDETVVEKPFCGQCSGCERLPISNKAPVGAGEIIFKRGVLWLHNGVLSPRAKLQRKEEEKAEGSLMVNENKYGKASPLASIFRAQ